MLYIINESYIKPHFCPLGYSALFDWSDIVKKFNPLNTKSKARRTLHDLTTIRFWEKIAIACDMNIQICKIFMIKVPNSSMNTK